MANDKRSRTNLVAGALSAGISGADTTISSAGLAGLAVIDATNHAAITIFAADGNGRILVSEIVYVTAHTAAATTATVVRGREGTSASAWSSGATWAHAPTTRDLSTGTVAFASRTAGEVTFTNTTTWVEMSSALRLVLPNTYAGDVVEVGVAARWSNQNAQGMGDAATLVSGSPVNYFGTTGAAGDAGVASWFGDSNLRAPIGGSVFKTVVSGDLSGTTLTIGFFARVTASKNMVALTTAPFNWWAKNHGPMVS